MGLSRFRVPLILGIVALGVATFFFLFRSTGTRPLAEGDAAPPFSLPAADGRTVSLQDYRGKKAVLLFFSMGPG